MLTRELLHFTTRKGRIRPRFLNRKDEDLRRVVGELLTAADHALGSPKREVDEALGAIALGSDKPKVARGLVKLITDRMEVREPGEEAWRRRQQTYEVAMRTLASLAPNATLRDYERGVEAQLDLSVDELRERLHEDLPDQRAVETYEPFDAEGLMDRYDLALAQGLVLYAQRLELEVPEADRPEVRRVLRFLRFCRLVAEVEPSEAGTRLLVDGPAAIFEGAKSYGLQMASFMTVVPTLSEWGLSAEVQLPRRSRARLDLSYKDPLSGRFSGGAGYVPNEVKEVLERVEIPGWTVDTFPHPRPVGARGLAVPDFALVSDAGPLLVVELFHRFHRGALERRLSDLEATPDPSFRVGVCRTLLKNEGLAERVESLPWAFSFRGFPSVRAIKALLKGPA